ncbi:MAG: tRNA (guanosine(37)-N1)-methyltransferase TrmD [Planctomycetota bacterium]|nr:tRNA (guanosine(37)-N1)-methyltransferase TrmD [Planctomycetota bacterium]MDA1214936.1 tRNA (guanosine(37)-N1)-methyltransferase TrmD [Planctomycetota bacterium]
MRFDIVTLFPQIFHSYLQQSLLKLAIQRDLVQVRLWDFRLWSKERMQKVDDKPFGGGPGMLIGCPAVFDCVEAVQIDDDEPAQLVMLTPQGQRWNQELVKEFARRHHRLMLLCGRYEGFDERIREGLKPREISMGDFITNGGEVPAMAMIDSMIRLIPAVLGDEASHREDTFSQHDFWEYPQYTRPRDFRGMAVPDVLLGGDHSAIQRWREEQSLLRSQQRKEHGE